jgi:hypothetical protein
MRCRGLDTSHQQARGVHLCRYHAGQRQDRDPGTYHAVAAKHLLRYLAEFSYSICQRYIAGMLALPAASQTPPMPYRLVKLAEGH